MPEITKCPFCGEENSLGWDAYGFLHTHLQAGDCHELEREEKVEAERLEERKRRFANS